MSKIRFDRFPGGKLKALTLSFDDGREYDRRFVQTINKYGLRGTFHLNSGFLGRDNYVKAEEVASLYEGHEISAHSAAHPHLDITPNERIVTEMMEDRRRLEALAGYPVRGMSYPFGAYNERVLALLPTLGIEYARTVQSTGKFDMPSNFLAWHPTCHHKKMLECAAAFLEYRPRHPRMSLLYVWGHSYEFENDANWHELDEFGALVGQRDDIWYATNADIAAYMQALERLRFSADSMTVHNPSAQPVWVGVEGEAAEIGAGAIVKL